MELDVKVTNENILIKEIKKQSNQLNQLKFPVRSSTKGHQFKRRSWVLPEGETVVLKEHQLEHKSKSNQANKEPSILLYFDVLLALKTLFKESAKQIEGGIREEAAEEDKEFYKSIARLILSKRKKVCDLLELYIHQQHMRAGANKLIESLQLRRHFTQTTVVKEQIERCILERKKNVERLLSIEHEIDAMSGTFRFKILGLLGFSRVCPGDVYEVVFKHGNFKYKSKCKIEALGQMWTDPEFSFQAHFSEDLNVKIIETAKIGKGNQLGTVACSLQEFMAASPMVFILPLNMNGTLKLKIGVHWNPLDKYDGKAYDKHRSPSYDQQLVDFSKVPVVSVQSARQQQRRKSSRDNNYGNGHIPTKSPAAYSPVGLNYTSPDQKYSSDRYPSSPVHGNQAPSHLNPTVSPKQHRSDKFTHHQSTQPAGIHQNHQISHVTNASNNNFTYEVGNRRSSNERSSFSDKTSIERSRKVSEERYRTSNEYLSSSAGHQHIHSHRKVSPKNSFKNSLERHSNQNMAFDYEIGNRRSSGERSSTSSGSGNDRSSRGAFHESFHVPRSNSDGLIKFQQQMKNKNISTTNSHETLVYNNIRETKVPFQMNNAVDLSASWTSGMPNQSSRNVSIGHPNQFLVQGQLTKSASFSNSKVVKSPPPQVKPKPRRRSTITPINALEILNERTVGDKVVDLCEKILSELDDNKALSAQVPGLSAKLKEITQIFQKSLSQSTSRRSSLTESISAALDSFDFLKEEGESNNSYPSTPTSSLPFQWSIGSRPLFHHLYMVYDLVYDYKIPEGPLIEREKEVIGKLQENLRALTELCIVINSYERLQAATACQQYSGSDTLANTWEVTVSPDSPLYCTQNDLFGTFAALYDLVEQTNANQKYQETKEKVCQYAVDELCCEEDYVTDKDIISMYQFVDFFKGKARSHSVLTYLTSITQELQHFTEIVSPDESIVSAILQEWYRIPVVPSCIKQLVLMHVSGKSVHRQQVVNTLRNVKDANKDNEYYELVSILLRCLEDRNAQLRAGACILLGKLKIHHSAQQLRYLHENEVVPLVKDAARNALIDIGQVH